MNNDMIPQDLDNLDQQIADELRREVVQSRPERPTITRPTVTRLNEANAKSQETRDQEDAVRRQRLDEHNRLSVEALVAKAWHERIRQMRGDVQPDIGPRDIHVRNLIIRSLMSILEDNPGFGVGEFEQLKS